MKLGLVGVGRIGQMHARTLCALEDVDTVVLADADPDRAREVAEGLGVESVATVEALYESNVDGVLIAAATNAHASLIHQALDHRVPVFCEKPVALDVPGTREVVRHAEESGVALQVGFQRRFDAGYRSAREAFRSGKLGWLHTLRAVTADEKPPPAAFIPTSGGLFRDCGIHDFDAIRWLTGREIVSVFGAGANRGADFFREGGDVDTAAAVLQLDDGTLATVTATRYNGAGHDVRLEVCGSKGALFVGHDERAPLPSAEAGVSWPGGEVYRTFMERFRDAYRAEMDVFVDVVSGKAENPCGADDALEALYVAEACERSRIEGKPVTLAEIRSQSAS
jgi:myo-inositol 2-dehydrogenase/D-chiro-inositol 1-dehydrogenase